MGEAGNDRKRVRTRWRRWAANLLILAGVAVLAYPAGTWVYTWYQQRALEQQLEEAHPALAGDLEAYFDEGMTAVGDQVGALRDEKGDLVEAARLAEAEREAAEFRARAEAFAEQVAGRGGEPIAKISIPRIDAHVVVIEGTGTNDLREGPGHWPETPVPGLGGNFVVSGHRTTYGAPFFSLDELQEGDVIRVALPYAAAEYTVTRSLIVDPDDVEVVAQRGIEEISLTTCHPIYSAAQRLVVQAELSGFRLLEDQAVGSARSRSG